MLDDVDVLEQADGDVRSRDEFVRVAEDFLGLLDVVGTVLCFELLDFFELRVVETEFILLLALVIFELIEAEIAHGDEPVETLVVHAEVDF